MLFDGAAMEAIPQYFWDIMRSTKQDQVTYNYMLIWNCTIAAIGLHSHAEDPTITVLLRKASHGLMAPDQPQIDGEKLLQASHHSWNFFQNHTVP